MIVNRKANFNYSVLENFKCGIILNGAEVKSIKNGETSIDEAYCLLINGELFIRGMYVKPYERARDVVNPTRDRKLLLRKKELVKIESQMTDKGLTIVPLIIYDKGLIKIGIGICKGKKNFDKRNSLREKDLKRENERSL